VASETMYAWDLVNIMPYPQGCYAIGTIAPAHIVERCLPRVCLPWSRPATTAPLHPAGAQRVREIGMSRDVWVSHGRVLARYLCHALFHECQKADPYCWGGNARVCLYLGAGLQQQPATRLQVRMRRKCEGQSAGAAAKPA
jgi:hypothetical protein